jgi:hypothetical protein
VSALWNLQPPRHQATTLRAIARLPASVKRPPPSKLTANCPRSEQTFLRPSSVRRSRLWTGESNSLGVRVRPFLAACSYSVSEEAPATRRGEWYYDTFAGRDLRSSRLLHSGRRSGRRGSGGRSPLVLWAAESNVVANSPDIALQLCMWQSWTMVRVSIRPPGGGP